MVATSQTYFQYGDHKHPNGEVELTRFEAIARYNARGERFATTYRLHVLGTIIADGASAINTAVADVVDAYAYDNQGDAGLYLSDGTATRHRLVKNAGNNMTGVRVVYRAWPRNAPDEYATARTFQVVLEATYEDTDSTTGVIHFSEQLRTIGGTGVSPEGLLDPSNAVWHWVPGGYRTALVLGVFQPTVNAAGYPGVTYAGNRIVKIPVWRRQYTEPWRAQQIIQSGRIIGNNTWPWIYVSQPIYPGIEQTWRRVITTGSPRWQGNRFMYYPIEWSYSMSAPPTTDIRNIQPTIPLFTAPGYNPFRGVQ